MHLELDLWMFNSDYFLLSISPVEKIQEKEIMRDQDIFEWSSPNSSTQRREVREDWTLCPIPVLQIKAEVITASGSFPGFDSDWSTGVTGTSHSHTWCCTNGQCHTNTTTHQLSRHRTQPHNHRHLHALIRNHNLKPKIESDNLNTVTHKVAPLVTDSLHQHPQMSHTVTITYPLNGDTQSLALYSSPLNVNYS